MARPVTYEELIDKYLECVLIHSKIDYADMKSVRRGNRAVDSMMKIVETIRDKHPDRVPDFANLLSVGEYKTSGWVAHHIVRYFEGSPDLVNRAISVIEEYATKDTVEGLGNRMWLEAWRKENAAK